MSAITQTVQQLPLSLLLLVHLHILQYPHVNKPEYDLRMLDCRIRGLRDRVKLMEDVCYFLVCEELGSKDRAKRILPTYPCNKPADVVAFRTALTKHLETLRQEALKPPSKTDGSTKTDGSNKKTAAASKPSAAASWWKDVVVRKSLLEECTGEKFERLMVSFATHVLLKGSKGIRSEHVCDRARSALPEKYSARLESMLNQRSNWVRTGTSLLKQQDDYRILREHIRTSHASPSGKYQSLTTERLVALAKSKADDTQVRWQSKGAYKTLVEIVGITVNPSAMDFSEHVKVASESKIDRQNVPVPVLAAAAARHPSVLRKLKKPILNSARPSVCTEDSAMPSTWSHRPEQSFPVLVAHREGILRRGQVLRDALTTVQSAAVSLQTRLLKPRPQSQPCMNVLSLWEPKRDKLHFRPDLSATPSALFESFDTTLPAQDNEIESRIDHIRNSILPSRYPAPSAPPAPSKIPQLKAQASQPPSRKPRPLSPPSRDTGAGPGGRKSVRRSLAAQRQRSMAESEEDFEAQSLVHSILQDTEDDEGFPGMETPKGQRILLSSPMKASSVFSPSPVKTPTPARAAGNKRPRASFLASKYPSLMESDTEIGEKDGWESDGTAGW